MPLRSRTGHIESDTVGVEKRDMKNILTSFFAMALWMLSPRPPLGHAAAPMPKQDPAQLTSVVLTAHSEKPRASSRAASSPDAMIVAMRPPVALPAPRATRSAAPLLNWQASARLRHTLGSLAGTLKVNSTAVEFQSPKGFSRRWTFSDIQTLDLWRSGVVLKEYEKRGRLRPGTRSYRFELEKEMPPAVAAEMAQLLGRPARNAIPPPDASSFAEIPAHHRTAFGGTKSNGTLRFRDGGMDYLTQSEKDSRSWRWADIRTLSNSDAYHLILFGYRETYSFDLKQPMTRELFDRLSEQVYTHNSSNPLAQERTEP